MKVFAAALAVSLLIFPLGGNCQVAGKVTDAAPTPVKAVLVAQRFELAEPYEDTWSVDKPMVSAGTLVVLDVDPRLVVPRESLNPVLYIDGKPTMRLNRGDISGHVLVIVPASTDVRSALMWFGTPDLPEALDAAKISAEKTRAERAHASKAGVGTQAARSLAYVERPAVQAKDLAALLRDVAAPLIDEFSAQDRAVAAMWRLPEGG
jgi:hypothetical protein